LNDKARSIDDLSSLESSEEEFVDSFDSLHDNQSLEEKDNSHNEQLTACPDSVEKLDEVATSKDEKSEEVVALSTGQNQSNDSETTIRGGKYNKKSAPKPPSPVGNVPAIKATLVLKPGVVKPLETPNAECKEVFVQSPRSKRRTLINRSLSISKGKFDSSLTKLMNLPKKIKDTLEKRSSWHDFSTKRKLHLVDTKRQSKSDNDLIRSVNKSDSRFSIQSLTESPMAHRRLKIIRRYVDEDID
jgi:hypothetical protein